MTVGAPAAVRGPRFVDLHMHSTASDGVLPPEEVVAAAARVNLAAIALTDHDNMAGVAGAANAALAAGITFVPGVELSTSDGVREIHMLGLHVYAVDVMEERLGHFRAARVERAEKILARLRTLGIPLSMDAVRRVAGDGAIGRPHVARCLMDGGYVADSRAAFERYLGVGRPAYVPKENLSVEDGIELIHAAGGLAIVAHPAADISNEELRRMKSRGLDGVEVYHPSHSPEDVARLAALCDEISLVRSGGSDWHGVDAGRRRLGGQEVPMHWLELQYERVAARRAGN